MHREGVRSGRSRNKDSTKRKRNTSSDPKYVNKNYNKPAKQKNITPFTWNRKCHMANRIYRQKDAKLMLYLELQEIIQDINNKSQTNDSMK